MHFSWLMRGEGVIHTETGLADFTKLFIRAHLLCLSIWSTFRACKLLFNCKLSTTMWTITFFSCRNPEKTNCCLEPCFELLTIAIWTKKSFKTYAARLLQQLQNPPPSLQISFWWEHFGFEVAPTGIDLSSQSLLSSLCVDLSWVQPQVPKKYLEEIIVCLKC